MRLTNPPQIVTLDLKGHAVAGDCFTYIQKWQRYFAELPPTVALLEVPGLRQDYFDIVNTKTRNMVRKAKKLNYITGLFRYNQHLDDMYEINRSSAVRQGQPMSRAYFNKLAPIAEIENPCPIHEQIYVGVFDEHKLVAYCWLAICNDVAIINRILGHADHLKNGIMNLLFYGISSWCQNKHVHWVNYRTMESTTNGLEKFKKHVGFKPVPVRILV